jgi:hypothetical protein
LKANSVTTCKVGCFSSLHSQVDEIFPVLPVAHHPATAESRVFDLVEVLSPYTVTVKTTKSTFQSITKTRGTASMQVPRSTIYKKRGLNDDHSSSDCVNHRASADASESFEVAAAEPPVKRSSRKPCLPARFSEYCCFDIPRLHESFSSKSNMNERAQQIEAQCAGTLGNVATPAAPREPLKSVVATSVDGGKSSNPALLFNGSEQLDAFLKIELSPEKYEQAKTLSHQPPAIVKCNTPINAPLVSMITTGNVNEAHVGHTSTPVPLLPPELNAPQHNTLSLQDLAQAVVNVPPTDTPLPPSPHLARLASSLVMQFAQFMIQVAQQTPTGQGTQPTPPQPPSGH